jgi:hypothetical protein
LIKHIIIAFAILLSLISCYRKKPENKINIINKPSSIIAVTKNRIYLIDEENFKVYKRIKLPFKAEKAFQPFPYKYIVLYRNRKIDYFNPRSKHFENHIYARNTAYNIYGLNPYNRLVYQSDTDVFLIKSNVLFNIKHISEKIDTSYTFGSGRYIFYRTKNNKNYILNVDSVSTQKFENCTNIATSPYLSKIYFIKNSILMIYDAKKATKKATKIKCKQIFISPAGNKLYSIDNDSITVIGTYRDEYINSIQLKSINNIIFAPDGNNFLAFDKDSIYQVDQATYSIVLRREKQKYKHIVPLNNRCGYLLSYKNNLKLITENNNYKITLNAPIINIFLSDIEPQKVNKKTKPKNIKSESITFYTVQYMSTKNKSHAYNQKNRLIKEGFPTYIKTLNINDNIWYRLRIGIFNRRENALKFSTYITETTNHSCWVAPDTLDSIPEVNIKTVLDLNKNKKQNIVHIDINGFLRLFEIDQMKISLIYSSEEHFSKRAKLLIKSDKVIVIDDDKSYILKWENNSFVIKESR